MYEKVLEKAVAHREAGIEDANTVSSISDRDPYVNP